MDPLTTSSNPELEEVTAAPAPAITTAAVLKAMLQVSPQISDLIFSPGRPPQVELRGQLVPVQIPQLPQLTPEDTHRIAGDLINGNKQAITALRDLGSCDTSYSLPGEARFRVNIFKQRGTCAIVMRVIPRNVPTFADLKLPPQLAEIANLKNGIVLVTGPTGSGKSSTMAAVVNLINETHGYHIITIEDPVEFIHRHKRSTIHQRELHSDTPNFSLALRAALRQAPKVILVGEMRDKETIEIAMEAAETGHLVLSTLHTIDASKTVERIIGVFPLQEQHIIRNRLSRSFRWIVSQRLIPRKDGSGRVAAFEMLKSTLRTREYMEKGEAEGKSLTDAMRDGNLDGMQCFDQTIEDMIRNGIVEFETGIAYATNPGNMRLELSDMDHEQEPEAVAPVAPKVAPKQEKHFPSEPELIIEA
ncbi:MAG TPA: PilT/PilU family type 4a pilus ATPase [Terriglobales bacterium]|jgi:twitching motility protein PilT|nr:PilT/PilU family type 4a pilus ATPase [Terriglobales bacterium]